MCLASHQYFIPSPWPCSPAGSAGCGVRGRRAVHAGLLWNSATGGQGSAVDSGHRIPHRCVCGFPAALILLPAQTSCLARPRFTHLCCAPPPRPQAPPCWLCTALGWPPCGSPSLPLRSWACCSFSACSGKVAGLPAILGMPRHERSRARCCSHSCNSPRVYLRAPQFAAALLQLAIQALQFYNLLNCCLIPAASHPAHPPTHPPEPDRKRPLNHPPAHPRLQQDGASSAGGDRAGLGQLAHGLF